MKEFLKNSAVYTKYLKNNTSYSRYNLNRNKNVKAQNEKNGINRLFYQACICAVLIVFLFAVLKIGGDNVSDLKNSLKEAVSSNITASQIEDFKDFVKKGFNSIKKSDLPFKNNNEETKAVIRIENTYSKGNIVVENTTAEEQSISPGWRIPGLSHVWEL